MSSKPEFPGIPSTADGSQAVVWVETRISDGACAYPITPTTNMGSGFQLACANGDQNLWGRDLTFLEPESEHSSASACEGFALAGGRTTNFTSGQGLVLMKEVLYTISGKRLPVVFHIGARAITSQSLNVHAGHDDAMAVADTGWGMLFARNAQEAQDLSLIARRVAEASRTPFMSVQDGFLTTHTIENIRLAEPDLMRQFVGAPTDKLVSLFDPAKPLQTGVIQNQDSYMKGRIAQRAFTDEVPARLAEAFTEFGRLTGRDYDFVRPYRMDDAEYAIVGMGSVMETAESAIDWVREHLGLRLGAIHVTCFRPFPCHSLALALGQCKAIAVIERTDNPLAKDNPLTMEVKASLADAASGMEGCPGIARMPVCYSGVYGLGSRDARVGDLIAVAERMRDGGPRFFTLGIDHPTALPRRVDPDTRAPGSFSMRGHSVGGFGSVTTNKVIASLVAAMFGLNVQAYPRYGSEKKGLPTTYYLTVSHAPIREHQELEVVEFAPIADINALKFSDTWQGIAHGGTIFLQSPHPSDADVWRHVPRAAQAIILDRKLKVLYLDSLAISRHLAPSPDLEQRMQGVVLLGVFLRVAPFVASARLSDDALFAEVEKALAKYFGRRGEKVLAANLAAVRAGYSDVHELDIASVVAGSNLKTGTA